MIKVGDLSNDELLARLRAHLGRGNGWLAGLLAYLAEVDARRLYAEHACSSMWDFCVRKLGMSEGEAQRRIAAARVVRQFPLTRGYLERGEIHLCAIYELHKHLTNDNHEELLREASGKSTRAVAEMIATRFPRPDVFPCIEPVVAQPALPMNEHRASIDGMSVAPSELVRASSASSPSPVRSPVPAPQPVSLPPVQGRSRLEPLSATRYRVELTVSAETKAKLERVRDLMCHRNPTGDLEKIFDLAIDRLLTTLEKERFGKTSRFKVAAGSVKTAGAASASSNRPSSANSSHAASPNSNHASSPNSNHAASANSNHAASPDSNCTSTPDSNCTSCPDSNHTANADTVAGRALSVLPETRSPAGTKAPKQEPPAAPATNEAAAVDAAPSAKKKTSRRGHISRAVLREVSARDGEQCTYLDAAGNRCPARGFLELDHIRPKALGGGDEALNLRLRCRAHNRLHAEQVFGREHVAQQIYFRHQKYGAAHGPSFETAARGLRTLGFRAAEVHDVITRLATTLDPATPVENIIKSALRLLT